MPNLTTEQRRKNELIEKATELLVRADNPGVPVEYKYFLIALADRYIELSKLP